MLRSHDASASLPTPSLSRAGYVAQRGSRSWPRIINPLGMFTAVIAMLQLWLEGAVKIRSQITRLSPWETNFPVSDMRTVDNNFGNTNFNELTWTSHYCDLNLLFVGDNNLKFCLVEIYQTISDWTHLQ